MSRRSFPIPLRAPFALFGAALLSAGCSAGSAFDGNDRPPPLTRHEICAKTLCDLERDECWSDIERCNATCIGGSIESFNSCYAVCESIDCPSCVRNESPCAVNGYRFSATGASDPALEAACERAVARDQRCSVQSIDPDCTHFSRIERPEAEQVYRCHSSTACGDDPSSCLEALPANEVGTELCGRRERACTTAFCDAEVVQAVNTLGRWLRQEVIDEAFACLQEPCDDVNACLWAWLGTVANIDA